MKRKPFSGVLNIIRFNWHFYAISVPLLFAGTVASFYISGPAALILLLLCFTGTAVIFISLFVSWYIYDNSGLYSLSWLNGLALPAPARIANINAGFDETSTLLKDKYPNAALDVYDFYDASKHTEISIERARKAYPPYSGTKSIDTGKAGLPAKYYDMIFLILAVHEIRNNGERAEFFRQLAAALTPEGSIVVVEHQRDFLNFLAFNIGFFHFHSPKTWLNNFKSAGLTVKEINKLTPFLKIYNLTVI